MTIADKNFVYITMGTSVGVNLSNLLFLLFTWQFSKKLNISWSWVVAFTTSMLFHLCQIGSCHVNTVDMFERNLNVKI